MLTVEATQGLVLVLVVVNPQQLRTVQVQVLPGKMTVATGAMVRTVCGPNDSSGQRLC
jgi:hypothetical protein